MCLKGDIVCIASLWELEPVGAALLIPPPALVSFLSERLSCGSHCSAVRQSNKGVKMTDVCHLLTGVSLRLSWLDLSFLCEMGIWSTNMWEDHWNPWKSCRTTWSKIHKHMLALHLIPFCVFQPHRKPQVGPHQLHTLQYIKLEIRRQSPSQAILSLKKTMMMLMSLTIQKTIILKQRFLPFGKQKTVHRAYFKNNQEWLKFNKCPGPKASGNIMELYKINTFWIRWRSISDQITAARVKLPVLSSENGEESGLGLLLSEVPCGGPLDPAKPSPLPSALRNHSVPGILPLFVWFWVILNLGVWLHEPPSLPFPAQPPPTPPTSHIEGLWVVVTAKHSCTQVTHHALCILQGWGCASCSCEPSPPTQPQAPGLLYDISQTNYRDPSSQPEFFHCFPTAL